MPRFLKAAHLLLFLASTLADKRHASLEPQTTFNQFNTGSGGSYASSGSYSGSFGTSGGGCPPTTPCANKQLNFPSGYQFAEEVFKGIPQVEYWWQGENSPFKHVQEFFKKCANGQCTEVPTTFDHDKLHGRLPANGCDSNGCSFSGTFDLSGKNGPKPGMIDLTKNPFLNGEFNSIRISSCTGSSCPGGKPETTITTCKGKECKTHKGPGEINLANNPFLKEGFAIPGAFGGSSFGTSGSTQAIPDKTQQKPTGFTSGGVFGGFNSGSSFSTTNGFAQGIPTKQPNQQNGFIGGSAFGQTAPTKPGQSGSFGTTGSASFGSQTISTQKPQGSVGFATSGFGGFQQNIPTKPGFTSTGSASFGSHQTIPTQKPGSFVSTGSASFGSQKPQQGSSGSFVTSGFGVTSGGFQQNIPTKPGQPTSFGSTGSASFQQTIPTQKPVQESTGTFVNGFGVTSGGFQQNTKPGQSGFGVSGSGSFQQTIPTQKPLQESTGTFVSGFGVTSNGFQQNTKPGQSGFGVSGSGNFQQTIPTQKPHQGGGFSGFGVSGSGGFQQTIPTKEPHQQTTGGFSSFGGSAGGFQQTIPTKEPQNGGFTSFGQTATGNVGFPTKQPQQTTFGGTFGGQTNTPISPNSPSFGGFQTNKPFNTQFPSGSGSTSGSFSNSFSGSSSGASSGSSSGSFNAFQKPAPTSQPESPINNGLFTNGVNPYTNPPVPGGSQTFTNPTRVPGPFTSGPHDYAQTIPTAVPKVATVPCSAKGHVCVLKYLCTDGYVNKNNRGQLDFKQHGTSCNAATEVCCKLDRPIPEAQSKTAYHPTKTSQSAHIAGSYSPATKDASLSLPSLNHFNPSSVQPGQTIQFGGSPGNSPGLIHILPNGQHGPGSTGGGGLVHIAPAQKPGLIHITPSTNDLQNKPVLSSSPTIRNNAYLPPENAKPPQIYTPELIPPSVPTPTRPPIIYQPQPSAPSPSTPYLPPPTPTPSKPTTQYIPPYKPSPSTPTNNAYLPPIDGSPSNLNPNTYIPPTTKPQPYLPPVQPDSNVININVVKPPEDINPDADSNQETILRPPKPSTEYPFAGDLNTTPYPGCAAALKCVKAEFCTADGVISETSIALTKEQKTNRVPLTSCTDPETNIVGKCCRDPKYKDPWPASQLGLYMPDGRFDNGQYRKNNDGKYKRPQGSNKPAQTRQPFEPNQIGAPSNQPGTFIKPNGYSNNLPAIPNDNRKEKPLYVDVNPAQEVFIKPKPSATNNKFSSATCGIRHKDTKPSGPGPYDAGFAEIPWQAMILRDTNRSLLCGGVIIRQDAVLTAAHCVENLDSSDVLVKGGEWKLGIDEEPKPFQIIKVAAIVRHPGYNPETRLNDVAILRLEEKFRKDKNVDTICLPAPGEDVQATFQGANCITTGWGKSVLQIHLLNALMHILETTILPVGQCQATLQQYHNSYTPLLNTNCFCGSPAVPNTDLCDVDIGSAMACDRGDGRFTFAGIYSWDTGCGSYPQVAGYQKVDFYWVEAQLQRPLPELRAEEKGAYSTLVHKHTGPDCECLKGK